MTFPEYLRKLNIDEGGLTKTQRAHLEKMFSIEQAEPPEPPKTATCADGSEVKVGDTVSLTLKVTGIHHHAGSPAHNIPDRTVLNLAMMLEGREVHFCTHDAKHCKKER